MEKFSTVIKDFSASWFSASMGTGVFALSSYLLSQYINSKIIGDYLFSFSHLLVFINFVLFFVLLVPMLGRTILFFHSVRKDFENPIKANFYMTIGISLLSLAANFSLIQNIPFLYLIFWLSGSFLVIFTELVIMVKAFIGTKVKIRHINPSWFLGATGLLLIPATGNMAVLHPYLGSYALFLFDISFGTGFFLYISLFSVWIYRFILHEPIRRDLIPTFWINMGPVGAFLTSTMSYYFLIPELDSVAYFFSLLFFGIGMWWFIMTLIITAYYLKNLKIPYKTVWWSFTFPTGQFLVGTIYFNMYLGHMGIIFVIIILYILLFFLWFLNVFMTLYSLIRGEIRRIQRLE